MEQHNQEMNIEKKESELPEPNYESGLTESEESSQMFQNDETAESLEEPVIESDEIPVEEKPEKIEPSKTQKFFQKALIWLIVIVIAFGSGFLLDHFLRYIPLKQDLSEVQSEMQTLNEDLDELDNQIELLRPRLEAANARISSLESDLEMANARSQLYQVFASVNNARLALFQEDFDAARINLAETKQQLEELAPIIKEVNPELSLSLPRRLELIIDGLERDPETASVDLELLNKDLLALESILFEE